MHCEKCGAALPSEGYICKNCGAMMNSKQIHDQKEFNKLNSLNNNNEKITFLSDRYRNDINRDIVPNKENKFLGILIVLGVILIVLGVAILIVL